MTGLLVSVRSAAEARLAQDGGADLIDVKEPAHGALGAATGAVWQAVREAVAHAVPVSAAVGELSDDSAAIDWSQLAGFAYAKLGLAGWAGRPDWPQRWQERLRRLPRGVAAVAVVYADWQTAQSPPPEAVLAEAARLSCSAVLLDTCDKRRGGLLAHFDLDGLGRLVRAIRRQGLQAVVGGSLDARSIPLVLRAQPDYIAVRGAVCLGSRLGHLDVGRVRELATLVKPPCRIAAANPLPRRWQIA